MLNSVSIIMGQGDYVGHGKYIEQGECGGQEEYREHGECGGLGEYVGHGKCVQHESVEDM